MKGKEGGKENGKCNCFIEFTNRSIVTLMAQNLAQNSFLFPFINLLSILFCTEEKIHSMFMHITLVQLVVLHRLRPGCVCVKGNQIPISLEEIIIIYSAY